MKRKLSELKQILCGCTDILSHEKGEIAVRFTSEQLDFYTARNELDALRVRCGAGIFLDFVTDAETIAFDYSFLASYVATSGIDIWENGEFALEHELVTSGDTHFEYRVKKPGGTHIRIYLPNGAELALRDFELGDFTPVERPERLALFYGDSVTQAAYTKHPSLTWAGIVSEALGVGYVNRGIGSFIFDVNSLPTTSDCAPELVFIEYGFNDLAQCADDDANVERARAYFERIASLYGSARVYVITTEFGSGAGDTPEAFARRAAYCTRIAELATGEFGFSVLRGNKLVPTLPDFFVADFVHLGDAGNALFAHGILKALGK